MRIVVRDNEALLNNATVSLIAIFKVNELLSFVLVCAMGFDESTNPNQIILSLGRNKEKKEQFS